MEKFASSDLVCYENKYINRCKECFGTYLNIRPTNQNYLQSTVCETCLRKNTNDTEWYRKARSKMDKFNSLGLNISKSFADYEKELKKVEYEDPFFVGIREFVFDTFEASKKPSCRTPITTEELILAAEYKFTKKLSKESGTIPNILGRMTFAFKIMSTKQRKSLTFLDNFGIVRDIERAKPEIHEGWHGEIVAISGPYLSICDLRVLLSLLKINFDQKNEGLELKTSLRNIAETMNITAGKCNLDIIKSSLRRITNSRINVTVLKGTTFTESFFLGGYQHNCVAIKWSPYLLAHYRRNQYAILNLKELFSLSDYAQVMYSFLITHEEKYKFISLNTWKKILGREHIELKYFKRDIQKSIFVLVERNLLTSKSRIDENNIVHTEIKITSDINPYGTFLDKGLPETKKLLINQQYAKNAI